MDNYCVFSFFFFFFQAEDGIRDHCVTGVQTCALPIYSENEIVFILVPHIIRGPDVAHGNVDMIDVGTANALALRHSGSKLAAPASSVAPAPVPQSAPVGAPQPQAPQGQAQNLAPQNQIPQTQAGASTGTFLFDPSTVSQAKGSTFTVNVMLSGRQNVYSVPVQLNYDPY